MKSTIGLQLIEFKVNADGYKEAKDIACRGGIIEIYGIECQYIGVTPDMLAHFWLGPGNFQSLNIAQLESQGWTLRDFQSRKV